jgi:hypothetical protein
MLTIVLNLRKLAWQSHNLSRDHKPSEKDESARIISRNGRIEAYRGSIYINKMSMMNL